MVENKVIIANYKMVSFACKNWHYSKSVPKGRLVSYGIFEDNKFIGVIVYSLGASNHLAKSFNLVQGECVELTRIAMRGHVNPVSRYISITLKMLQKQCKTVKIVVSFADMENQNHNGGIYQASNWIYLGVSESSQHQYLYNGVWTHYRTFGHIRERKGREYTEKLIQSLPSRKNSDKHKYIYCFDKDLKEKYDKLKKEYPKKCVTQ